MVSAASEDKPEQLSSSCSAVAIAMLGSSTKGKLDSVNKVHIEDTEEAALTGLFIFSVTVYFCNSKVAAIVQFELKKH